MSGKKPGYFVFSLDTELAWGFFDLDERRAALFSSDGSRERWSIQNVLKICDEYGIVGTWAIVGHMLLDHSTECAASCPVAEWEGKYHSFEQINTPHHPLWYGLDVVDAIRSYGGQEIGFHGYSHEVFNEGTMSRDRARAEVECWLEAGRRVGLTPRSIVFPRNQIGHLDVFREAGFTSYRGEPEQPWLIRNRYSGTPIKYVDHILALSTPPTYELDEMVDETHGLVVHNPSVHMFGFNRRLELWLDGQGMHLLRVKRFIRGIQEAAVEGKVFHLRAHPWEFRTEKDMEKLRFVFAAAAEEIGRGRMIPIGMSALADIVMETASDPAHP
jgi:peptidoglycan/xylan/chitin deacetylase (PgdA/CDA1 family)